MYPIYSIIPVTNKCTSTSDLLAVRVYFHWLKVELITLIVKYVLSVLKLKLNYCIQYIRFNTKSQFVLLNGRQNY